MIIKNRQINKFVILAIFMLLLPMALASQSTLGTFKTNEDITLIQLCANCTFNNITLILDPNGTILIANQTMVKQGSNYFFILNASFVGTVGQYNVNGLGDIDGLDTVWSYSFHLTKTGAQLTTGASFIYTLLTIGVFLMFLFSMYFSIMIPYSNKVSDNGMVFKVTRTKYIKLGFVMLTYGISLWLLNILIALSDNFLGLSLFFGLVSSTFFILLRLALPFSIFILILMFFEVIRDSNIVNAHKLFGGSRNG